MASQIILISEQAKAYKRYLNMYDLDQYSRNVVSRITLYTCTIYCINC